MSSPASSHDHVFPHTRWSLVVIAKGNHSEARTALDGLCRIYWRPIYAFARHKGLSAHDAEDVTQAFFADLLERGYIQNADQGKGRFRAFLIHDLKFFLSNEAMKGRALKRGGEVKFVPIDTAWAESHQEIADPAFSDADAYFDRQWALETVRLARERVGADYKSQGKEAVFIALQSGLVHPPDAAVYDRWQQQLGMNVGALRVALHRLRDRFKAALEEQVLETVSSKEDLEAELRHLRHALGKARSAQA
ncbi:MAG: RNA polymerase sigma factor [Verrucomicrobiaceae bacterium]